jgi:hypothetical protein
VGLAVAPQGGTERRGGRGHLRQPLLQQLRRAGQQFPLALTNTVPIAASDVATSAEARVVMTASPSAAWSRSASALTAWAVFSRGIPVMPRRSRRSFSLRA